MGIKAALRQTLNLSVPPKRVFLIVPHRRRRLQRCVTTVESVIKTISKAVVEGVGKGKDTLPELNTVQIPYYNFSQNLAQLINLSLPILALDLCVYFYEIYIQTFI